MAERFYERVWHVSPSLHSDNQSAIDLINNQVYHDRIKYIDVQYHFIHIFLKDGVLLLEKIHTSHIPANMLAKIVTIAKLKTC